MSDNTTDPDELAAARATIQHLKDEIGRLNRKEPGESFANDLRSAVALASAAGQIASPVSTHRLLQMIVEMAAHIVSASSGSLLLVDKTGQELVFEVAIGPKAAEVMKFRVPIGHGIAGNVAATGQAEIISDAAVNPRQADDIAGAIDFNPNSILCVPLFVSDRVIGVLELLEKQGKVASKNGEIGEVPFEYGDINKLALFADLASAVIEQSRVHSSLTSLIVDNLSVAVEAPSGSGSAADAFADSIGEESQFQRSAQLAALVHQIAEFGDSEATACGQILNGFLNYLQQRNRSMSGLGL